MPEGASVAAMSAGRDQPLTSGGSGGHYSPGLGRAGHVTSGDTATPPSGKPLPPSPHLTYASILRRDRQAGEACVDDDDESTACTIEEAMCDADDDCCQGNVATPSLSSARCPRVYALALSPAPPCLFLVAFTCV